MRPAINDLVAFLDANATTSTGAEGIAQGRVNGEALDAEDGTFYVPVWTSRDNGREPTTVYVPAVNIVAVNGKAWVTTQEEG